MPLSHKQFKVNEVWIACRVNESFLFVQSEPYDVYALMGARSAYVLGFAMAKVVEEAPDERELENLFMTAYRVIIRHSVSLIHFQEPGSRNPRLIRSRRDPRSTGGNQG